MNSSSISYVSMCWRKEMVRVCSYLKSTKMFFWKSHRRKWGRNLETLSFNRWTPTHTISRFPSREPLLFTPLFSFFLFFNDRGASYCDVPLYKSRINCWNTLFLTNCTYELLTHTHITHLIVFLHERPSSRFFVFSIVSSLKRFCLSEWERERE